MNVLLTPLPESGGVSLRGFSADDVPQDASLLKRELVRGVAVGLDRGLLLPIPSLTLDVDACRQLPFWSSTVKWH